ncbi:hypothetical protein PI126_g11550 [Phytophthora idaei]|nr:hypothetical protein PI126_g11550 [Phytophthora idaei]
MLQWLLDHPLGRELRTSMKPRRKYSYLLQSAARNNHTDIVQYLYEQGAANEVGDDRVVKDYARELMVSIGDDRYNSVKWMVQNIPFPTGIAERHFMFSLNRVHSMFLWLLAMSMSSPRWHCLCI